MWTVLSQGFQDKPPPVCQGIRKRFEGASEWEIQYVDEFLSYSITQDIPNANTVLVFNFLADRGHKVSKSKAQVFLQEVYHVCTVSVP
jgi:hypothetical protein